MRNDGGWDPGCGSAKCEMWWDSEYLDIFEGKIDRSCHGSSKGCRERQKARKTPMLLAWVTRRMELFTVVEDSAKGTDLRRVDQQLNIRHVILRSGLAIQLFVFNHKGKKSGLENLTQVASAYWRIGLKLQTEVLFWVLSMVCQVPWVCHSAVQQSERDDLS